MTIKKIAVQLEVLDMFEREYSKEYKTLEQLYGILKTYKGKTKSKIDEKKRLEKYLEVLLDANLAQYNSYSKEYSLTNEGIKVVGIYNDIKKKMVG